MNELDPDIASLFDAEDAPPRDPVFAAGVTRRIAWIRTAQALLTGSSGLAVAACAWFAGPTIMELGSLLVSIFTPILASQWTSAGLVVAGAVVFGTLYLLRAVRLSVV